MSKPICETGLKSLCVTTTLTLLLPNWFVGFITTKKLDWGLGALLLLLVSPGAARGTGVLDELESLWLGRSSGVSGSSSGAEVCEWDEVLLYNSSSGSLFVPGQWW